jgi:choline-sulfatase
MLRGRIIIILVIAVVVASVLGIALIATRTRHASVGRPVNLAVGAKFRLPKPRTPAVVRSYDFDRDGDAEGWRVDDKASRAAVGDGLLVLRKGATPGTLSLAGGGLLASQFNLVQLSVRDPGRFPNFVRWMTVRWKGSSGDWSPGFSSVPVPRQEAWQTISIPVGRSPEWQGLIGSLAIEFQTDSMTVEIDWIRLCRDENPLFVHRSGRVGYAVGEQLKWVIPQPLNGTLRMDVTMPKWAHLHLSCGLTANAWRSASSPVFMRVRISGQGGRSQILTAVDLSPKARGGTWRWRERDVDLSEWAGRRVSLTFETSCDDSRQPGFALWGNPTVRSLLQERSPSPPNFVIVLIDALRPDHLGTYGYSRPTSPNIDRLAKQGVVFDNAFAQASYTGLSISSLLTSLYPSAAGSDDSGAIRLRQRPVTIAENLQRAGYVNAAFSVNPLVHWDYGFAQGFATFTHCLSTHELIDDTIAWVGNHARRPFFVYLHLMDTHSPYVPAELLASRFTPADYKPSDPDVRGGDVARMRARMARGHTYGEPDRRYLESLYDGCVASADAEVGRLAAGLKRMGVYHNTVIIICADHGEEFWEHGGLEHARTLYQESLRVPLILKLPAGMAKQTRREEAVVRLVDVYPTVSELAGLSAPAGIRGENLLQLKRGVVREVYAEREAQRALRRGDWNLIMDGRNQSLNELYDLKNDPLEKKNVAAEHPDVVRRLSAGIMRLDREAQSRAKARADSDSESGPPDSVTLERLRSLGYIE